MDVQATKMMSIHLEALLPPTSIELDIQQNILVAALLGVGLLYQETVHAHYAQVLLNEIGIYHTYLLIMNKKVENQLLGINYTDIFAFVKKLHKESKRCSYLKR